MCIENLIIATIAISAQTNSLWVEPANDKTFYIGRLASSPDYARTAICRRMLNFTEKIAKENNGRSIRVDIYETETRLCDLVTKWNYTLQETKITEKGNRVKLFEKAL